MNSQTRRDFLKSAGLLILGSLMPQIANAERPQLSAEEYRESRHFWTVLNGNHCEVKQEIPVSGEYCGPEVKLSNYKVFSPDKKQRVIIERYQLGEFNPLFNEGGLEEFIEVTRPNSDSSRALGLIVLPNDSYCRFYNGNESITYNKGDLDENSDILDELNRAVYGQLHLTNSDISAIRRFRQIQFDKWEEMLKSLSSEQIAMLPTNHPLFSQILHADKTEDGRLNLILYDRNFESGERDKDYSKLIEILKKLSKRTKEDEVRVMVDSLSDRFGWKKYI